MANSGLKIEMNIEAKAVYHAEIVTRARTLRDKAVAQINYLKVLKSFSKDVDLAIKIA